MRTSFVYCNLIAALYENKVYTACPFPSFNYCLHMAQRKHRPAMVDTLISNYQPADLFSPMFYPERGNEIHAANGEPGPKYWQNRANYHIKANY